MHLIYWSRGGERLDRPLIGTYLVRMQADLEENRHASQLFNLFNNLVEEDGTDLLFTAGVPPTIRKHSDIVQLGMPL